MQHSALLVDDDGVTLELLSQILNSIQFGQVVQSKSFTDGKQKIQTEIFDVAFVDIELGDGNGLDLIKELKEYSPITKIIMISSHSSSENVKVAIAQGANAFLTKPFNVQKLLKTLSQFGIKVEA